MQKTKKKLNFCFFAEGNDQGPRQRRAFCRGPLPLPSAKIFWKNSAKFLCRTPWLEALGKDFWKKKLKFLCREHVGKPSAKIFFKKKNNSLPSAHGDSPRQRRRPWRRRRDGCFSLPSAAMALGKGFAEDPLTLFADSKFPESSLPRAALYKAFAKG
jgi:hypothetical protein